MSFHDYGAGISGPAADLQLPSGLSGPTAVFLSLAGRSRSTSAPSVSSLNVDSYAHMLLW